MNSGGKLGTGIGLAIAAAGVVFAAIQSWPVITGSFNKSGGPTVSGGQSNCANVEGGAGTVDCRTINAAPQERPFRVMETSLEPPDQDPDSARDFVNLVDRNSGKIVRLDFMIDRSAYGTKLDYVNEKPRLVFFIADEEYDTAATPGGTEGREFVIGTEEGGEIHQCLGVYYCVSGYFSIEPVAGSMMGGGDGNLFRGDVAFSSETQ